MPDDKPRSQTPPPTEEGPGPLTAGCATFVGGLVLSWGVSELATLGMPRGGEAYESFGTGVVGVMSCFGGCLLSLFAALVVMAAVERRFEKASETVEPPAEAKERAPGERGNASESA